MSRPTKAPGVLARAAAALLAAMSLSVLVAPAQGVAAPGRKATRAFEAKRRPPLLVVRPVGAVHEDAARLTCRALLAQLPVRCEIRAGRSLADFKTAVDEDRRQLNARAALEIMFRDRAADALVEINLTGADIFEPGKPFIFGLASLSDRVAVISTARLTTDHPSEEVFADRLTKLVMHEGGHTFGMHHHDHADCVMRQDPSVSSLDEAPATPCTKCRKRLVRRARRLGRPGQLALDRARSHLVRNEASTARQMLLGTVWADAYDDAVLLEFGVAFQQAGEIDDAIGILKFLVDNSPEHARAHVNLGLAYQRRAEDGDRELAIKHFERALELRPQWSTVAAHLDVLQAAPPAAQGPTR